MVVPADDSLSVIARSWDGRYASQPVTVRSAAGDNPRAGLHENCQAAGTLQLEAPAPSGPAGNGATAFLPLLPASDWTRDPGDINPECSPPNPSETSFEAVGTGVVMRAAANGMACCSCVRRWRAWKLPATFSTAKTHLRGYLETDHSTGMYVAPSFRVELIRGGSTRVGAKIFVTERTNNNNCAGSSERPEVLLRNPPTFDIDLSTLAASDTFDELRVYLMAYGCGTVTMKLGVSRLLLETR